MTKTDYDFERSRFIADRDFDVIKSFAATKETPFVVIDLEIVRRKYRDLIKSLPFARIFYAVKSNPMDEVILLLKEMDSNFDIASRYELDQILRLGVDPERISYGNTIKKEKDIEYAYNKGVRLFVTDSLQDLLKIARNAPSARVYFRIITDGTGSDWPLSRKFGAHPDWIYSLIMQSRDLGLDPFGLSFHVGSQQRDIGQWDEAISRCKYLFDSLKEKGINLKMINLGGGLPANYLEPTLPVEMYAAEIKRFLLEDFGETLPEIWMEPGRSLVADAGILIAEIVLISQKSRSNLHKWVYLDVGVFGGLIETLGEAIKYPVYFDKEGPAEEIIIAGPTCDGMDIMYEHHKYSMPSSTVIGDRVYFFTAGAYTQSYSSINFNGFPPLKSYVLPE
jgi:ornithine decarboxylase